MHDADPGVKTAIEPIAASRAPRCDDEGIPVTRR
jgi:hypothetical protein